MAGVQAQTIERGGELYQGSASLIAVHIVAMFVHVRTLQRPSNAGRPRQNRSLTAENTSAAASPSSLTRNP